MKVEFVHVTGFESWYENKQKSMQSADDFEFFNKMRIATVHINRVKPNKKVSIGILESVQLANSVDPAQNTKKTVIPTEPSEENVSTSSRIVERFFKEYPEKKLDGLCDKYLKNLTILLDECEKLLNNANFHTE